MSETLPLETADDIFAALRENNERPYGTGRTVRAEHLVEAAELLEDKGALVTALFELMSAYTYGGEERKSPVVFARIIRLWDERPEDFSEWEAHQLHWRFKWVTTALLQVPEVPLDAVRRWTQEMRERYAKAGHGMQPVYAMRYLIAAHAGAGADDAYDLWVTRPRTDLSDCPACETRGRARHLSAAGDDERALREWAPVLGGEQTCREEPYASMAYALLPLLRTGRLDEARSHHLTGYRSARGKADMADAVGRHLEFCALSRNEGRGLEILAENRELFGLGGSPLDLLDFLTGAEVLLGRLAGQGHGGLAVAGPPGRSWTVDALLAHTSGEAARLAAAFDRRNGTTAVSDGRSARLAGSPLVDEPLPLGLRASTAARLPVAPATGAAGAPGAGTRTGAAASAAADALPETVAALVGRARALSAIGRPDADALWERVRTLTEAEGYAHDEAAGPEAVLRAELAERRAFDDLDGDRWEAARAAMLEAAGRYEAAGLPGRAVAARARAATALVAADADGAQADLSAARAELDAELRLARALTITPDSAMTSGDGTEPAARTGASAGTDAGTGTGTDATSGEGEGTAATADGPRTGIPRAADVPPAHVPRPGDGIEADRYLAVLQCAAMLARHDLLAGLPEPEPALRTAFDEAVASLLGEAERLGSPSRASAARQYAADVAARTGAFEEATAELTRGLDLLESAGQPWRTPRPLALLAQIKVQCGQAEQAVPLVHRALAAAARWPDPSLPAGPLHALLGHACAHCGDVTAAVRHLSEAADRLDRENSDAHAAQVRLELADVLSEDGRTADAVAVLESVVLDGAENLDPRMLAQVRLNLARGLGALGERRAAAEEFLRLADEVAAWQDEQDTHTLVACEAAVALARAELWDAARTAYGRAVDSHAKAPRPAPVLAMMREFARLTMAAEQDPGPDRADGTDGRADRLPAALAHLAEADAVMAAVPSEAQDFVRWYQTGAIHYQRARCHTDAQDYEEALAEAQRALTAYEQGGPAGEEPRAEAVRIAALIEANALHRPATAGRRLADAAARCRAAGLDAAAAALDATAEGIAARASES